MEKPTSSGRPFEALGGLYQEIIVEHSRHPRHKKKCEGCAFFQEGKNPLCGDEVCIYLNVDEQSETRTPRISAFFEGRGCTISQASASMMCDIIQGVTPSEAHALIEKAEDIYSGHVKPSDPEDIEDDLEALSGVSKFPVRIKCAALPWKALEMLLAGHFNEKGELLNQNKAQCVATKKCEPARKLRIVSTEE